MDRLLDACRGVIRGIQDLRVEIEDVVGELTRWKDIGIDKM